MDVLVYKLGDAGRERRVLLADAEREFNQAVERAARVAAMRQRAIDSKWDAARRQAKKVAHVRVGIWREHEALDTAELRMRLGVHEWRLSPGYQAVQPTSGMVRAGELWYARMIQNILARRSGSRVLRVQARPVAS